MRFYIIFLAIHFAMFDQMMAGGTNLDDCNSNSGPSGLNECVLLEPEYTKYQWATCITDSYMQAKSKGRHHCTDRSRIYCWYQCMLEVYDDGGSGPVYGECECDPREVSNTPLSTLPSIPDWCFSPDGRQCNWYRDCLEKRFPCEDTDDKYALTYAEHFCQLYTDNRSKFSYNGQKWINGVRKCLQVTLVPILRRWNTGITCEKIREKAFNSHSDCYYHPGYNAPSICDLGTIDWWTIFWTIKGSFLMTPAQSMKGLWDVGSLCKEDLVLEIKNQIRFIQMNFEDTRRRRNIRSVSNVRERNSEDDQIFAGKIGDAIAKSMNWKDDGVAWFAYRSNSSEDVGNDVLQISVLIGSKRKYDVNAKNASRVDLNSTLSRLSRAVRQGTLSISVDHSPLKIRSFAGCENLNCNSTYLEVLAPPTAAGSVKNEMTWKIVLPILILFFWNYK